MKQTVVPSGTGKASSDIVRVIYSILLFPFCCLVLYLYLLYILGRKKNTFIVALANVPVEAFYWRRVMADECKHDVT